MGSEALILDQIRKLLEELRRGQEDLQGQIEELREDLQKLEIRLDRLENITYAVESGVQGGRREAIKIREYREQYVSDYRGFNSRKKIKAYRF